MRNRSHGAAVLRVLLLLALTAAAALAGTGNPNDETCSNAVIVTGRVNGRERVIRIPVTRIPFEWNEQKQSENTLFYEHKLSMRSFAPVSYLQNCAGYVTQKLWGFGPYMTNVDHLHNVLTTFGRQLWFYEKAKRGDIVIYGANIHIAYVVDDSGAIEGKDNQGPYMRYAGGSESRAAVDQWGKAVYWRLEPGAIQSVALEKPADACPPCTTPAIQCPPAATVSCDDAAKHSAETVKAGIEKDVRKRRLDWFEDYKTQLKIDFAERTENGPGLDTITRTFTARESCLDRATGGVVDAANESSCTQVLTVERSGKPRIRSGLKAQLQVQCAGDVPEGAAQMSEHDIAARGACGEATTLTFSEERRGSGCPSDPLVITRTFVAKSAKGVDSDPFVQTITVADRTAPKISLPAAQLDPNVFQTSRHKSPSDATKAAPPLVASDNCGEKGLEMRAEGGDSDVPGAPKPGVEAIRDRVFRAYDGCGNKSAEAVRFRFEFEKKAEQYGPFAVPWNQWFPTGVSVRKGDRFTVKAKGEFRHNQDPKSVCGLDGCGYWSWFVLKIKVGEWMQDVGSEGGGEFGADGVVEFGTPRVAVIFPEDSNRSGTAAVELTVNRQ